ncbi:TVP38/TMEM64 family protein [Hyphomicrobium sp.]|uniref:TVP38/TMEM64 family protein n=1 Tax=Hyphomicrobium sp. TaxID=82 RepID=UPI001D7EB6AD|nr:TVP38/TMEM64 family protein [Hyphomicrobium sp.]MBY0560454.1 TVP38/TMEM64 family protein [Hyphomicrobium sp.]
MTLKRLLPLLVLVALLIGAFALRLDRYVTLDALRDNRAALSDLVQNHSILSGLIYILVYIVAVALSFPGATILTLAGGLLFGAAVGASLTVIGATAGATILFLIARSAAGDILRRQAGPFLARLSEGFSRNAFNYLLFLRLVPAFPFWVVNLAPAILGMRLLPYIVATGIGIIPGTFVFSAFGASLGTVFDAGREVHLKDVLSPTLIAGLVVLGFLSLLPILLKSRARQEH